MKLENQLRRLLSSPVLANEKQSRITRILYIVLFILSVAAAFLLLVALETGNQKVATGIGVANLFFLLAFWLIKKNHLKNAQHTLTQQPITMQNYILELEQKRLTQERIATQLQTAAEIAQQLTLILDPQELINQIVTLLQNRFHFYHVQVYLLDENSEQLIMQAGSGTAGTHLRQINHRIPLARQDSLVARAAREQQILVVNDVKQEKTFLPNPLLPETCAEVTVPLLVKGQILGVLDIQENKVGAIHASDLNTFYILAGQIAIALENARLFSKLLHSEAALREGESRYRSLFEDSPLSLWESDLSGSKKVLDGVVLAEGQSWRACFAENPTLFPQCLAAARVLDVNQVTVQMFAAQDKHALYAGLGDIFTSDVLGFLQEQFIALANGLISFAGEMVLQKLTGEQIDVLYRLIVAPGYEETWGKTFISLIDITNRKRVERALQAERDFAQQVINNMGQGLTVVDANGRFEFVNPAYVHMTGFAASELLNKTPYDLTDPQFRTELIQSWEKRQKGQSNSYETRLVHADGHFVNVMITGVPRQENGQIIGSIAVVTDLTERKQAEQEREQLIAELENKNAELGRFTYTVSHDLKSPLVTIKGFLGMLEKDIAKNDKQRIQSDIERIRSATITMETLLNDLLELSRVGRLVKPPQAIAFETVTKAAVERVMGQVVEREVKIEIADHLPSVYVDPARLTEALQNLLDNAIKFMGNQPAPLIQIGVETRTGEMVFYVRDNGLGIAPRYHEKVFGLFERLNPAIEGTGIGLALVKRIIEVHNGRIWVESDGDNKGSTFYFTLPLVEFVPDLVDNEGITQQREIEQPD